VDDADVSEIRLAAGRRLVVCDVCLTYVDHGDPMATTWQRETPGRPGSPDRCPDCAIPVATTTPH
jgi:hypothetical protein